MFSVREVITSRGTLQYRAEHHTGLRCRIGSLTGRIGRSISHTILHRPPWNCPFCPCSVMSVTPTFPDGKRILRGESVTFPNLFPFGECHVVTVMTREHSVPDFSRQQVVDALLSQVEALGWPAGMRASTGIFSLRQEQAWFIPICRVCRFPPVTNR